MIERLTSNQKVLGSNPSWSRFFLDVCLSLYLIIHSMYLCSKFGTVAPYTLCRMSGQIDEVQNVLRHLRSH